MDGEAMTLC